ncbi:MAG: peptidase M23 [Cyclobacteriaceae bacterium]|nr:MAG: peptidase M23 [Cyclobacteriaceae bacterium]
MNASKFLAILLIGSLALGHPALSQQERNKLEREKKENLAKIKEAEKILQQTSSQKKNTLGQLQALSQQIRSQESLIQTYRANIKLLNGEINESESMVNSLEQDLKLLKEEYAEMIYQANKAQNNFGSLSFLFSATSFRQLVMRAKYLKQYTNSRQDQAREIQVVQSEINQQIEKTNQARNEQKVLLAQQELQNRGLITARKQQNTLVKQLALKEKDLQSDLKKRKQAIARLDRMIAEVIKLEMEKSKNAKGNFELTPDGIKLSTNFQGNQKRLTWPVARGFVSSKFGLQPHPVLKGVKIENPGVDIQTQKNEVVRAVFDGEVSKIASVPGMNGVVIIIQHGEYRTVYANLSKSLVHMGDQVKTKDPIGEVFTDSDGVSEVQFQVWKNFNKLDPLAWLQPK